MQGSKMLKDILVTTAALSTAVACHPRYTELAGREDPDYGPHGTAADAVWLVLAKVSVDFSNAVWELMLDDRMRWWHEAITAVADRLVTMMLQHGKDATLAEDWELACRLELTKELELP